MKLFFDHNLSHNIPKALQLLFPTDEITHITDKFRIGVSDLEWIEGLNKEGGWVVLSGDTRITRNAAERAAFKRSRLHGFFIAPGLLKKGPVVQTYRILHHWNEIEKLVKIIQPGATFALSEKRIKAI
jgi:hypothetical protein